MYITGFCPDLPCKVFPNPPPFRLYLAAISRHQSPIESTRHRIPCPEAWIALIYGRGFVCEQHRTCGCAVRFDEAIVAALDTEMIFVAWD
jgi:hypothetical protein